ncbi:MULTISPECIES: enterochelin esterase domain-containing protein [unclassified Streptomyces]|uniref:enterochelin esterase domain-containing protein n=1 Tax=unclassified Streptomyces TaxID=2593676 RepID=UPI000BEFB6F2|nr:MULTISPECIES: enterochelin esterase domain-containing protein [unclassified Streptomyces]
MSDAARAADAAPRPVTGPRVARLARQLENARDPAARDALTEAFWDGVTRTGTPLVEALDGAPGHRAVTFLWRGHRATRQVLLMATGIGDRDRPADTLLHHLPGTDVWYLGYRLRADHRGSYRLVADISPGPAPADPALLQRRLVALTAHGVADPLNPRRLPVRRRAVESSVFALPEAPPQPWAGRRAGVRRGAVERHTVPGRTPGEEREVWTYLPPEGADRPGGGRPEPLPVLVLCDGGMWFGRLGFQDTLDALIADGALPPLAVLSPDADDAATGQCDPGGREARAAFLADELLPWARARWPLTADADRTAVSGQGPGGTTALYAVLTRPERFGRALVQSPAPGPPDDGGDRTPGEGHLPPGRGDRMSAPVVHLALGLHDGAASVEYGEALVPALRARGHRVVRTVHNGGRDHACWQGLLADALVETFR